MMETVCLMPQLGSGPFTDTPGSGFYTIEDYKDILTHAARLFIEVIPEFDMPGHSRAAIKSMEQRTRNFPHETVNIRFLSDRSRNFPETVNIFLLSDRNDSSQYMSIQNFNDNSVNPCMESTYTFVKHLVREVKQMHEGIQPLHIFHFGGDEVPKGAWVESPICQKLMQEKSISDSAGLKEYFVQKVVSIIAAEGLDPGAWEDGLNRDYTPYARDKLNAR